MPTFGTQLRDGRLPDRPGASSCLPQTPASQPENSSEYIRPNLTIENLNEVAKGKIGRRRKPVREQVNRRLGNRGLADGEGRVAGILIGATPLGLEGASAWLPRVARASQPRAGGRNPFGIEGGGHGR